MPTHMQQAQDSLVTAYNNPDRSGIVMVLDSDRVSRSTLIARVLLIALRQAPSSPESFRALVVCNQFSGLMHTKKQVRRLWGDAPKYSQTIMAAAPPLPEFRTLNYTLLGTVRELAWYFSRRTGLNLVILDERKAYEMDSLKQVTDRMRPQLTAVLTSKARPADNPWSDFGPQRILTN